MTTRNGEIRVTASDPGGLTATQTFSVTVGSRSAPFTEPEIVPGVTPSGPSTSRS